MTSLRTASADAAVISRATPDRQATSDRTRRFDRPFLFRRLILWLVLGPIVFLSVRAGVEFRRWVWPASAELRFHGDIMNAMNQGRAVVGRALRANSLNTRQVDQLTTRQLVFDGFVGRYQDEVENARSRRGREIYGLDYPPLRLLTVSLWMHDLLAEHGWRAGYRDDRVRPLLNFNLVMESLTAVGVFVLVRVVSRRAGRGPNVADMLAVAATILFWFNPALILDAHAWPQWDAWVLPFFVWAVVAALFDRWTVTGMLIAVGACFKGQLLFVLLPLFAWPIFAGKPERAFRLFAGLAAGMLLVAWPFLIRTTEAVIALVGVTIVAATLACWPRQHRFRRWHWVAMSAGLVLTIVALQPWTAPDAVQIGETGSPGAFRELLGRAGSPLTETPADDQPPQTSAWVRLVIEYWPTAALAAGAVSLPLIFRDKARVAVILLLLAGAGLVAGDRLGGSFAWYKVGFPTDRHYAMHAGPTFNLPAILQDVYGVNIYATLLGLPVRRILQGLAAILVLVCAVGLARHHNRDRTFLLAIVTPWLIVFAVTPQMHERYLLWAASLSSVFIAVSLAGVLAHLALSVFAATQILLTMYLSNGGPSGRRLIDAAGLTESSLARTLDWINPGLTNITGGDLVQIMSGMNPHAGWAVLAIAFALTAASLSRRERKPAAIEPKPESDPNAAKHLAWNAEHGT